MASNKAAQETTLRVGMDGSALKEGSRQVIDVIRETSKTAKDAGKQVSESMKKSMSDAESATESAADSIAKMLKKATIEQRQLAMQLSKDIGVGVAGRKPILESIVSGGDVSAKVKELMEMRQKAIDASKAITEGMGTGKVAAGADKTEGQIRRLDAAVRDVMASLSRNVTVTDAMTNRMDRLVDATKRLKGEGMAAVLGGTFHDETKRIADLEKVAADKAKAEKTTEKIKRLDLAIRDMNSSLERGVTVTDAMLNRMMRLGDQTEKLKGAAAATELRNQFDLQVQLIRAVKKEQEDADKAASDAAKKKRKEDRDAAKDKRDAARQEKKDAEEAARLERALAASRLSTQEDMITRMAMMGGMPGAGMLAMGGRAAAGALGAGAVGGALFAAGAAGAAALDDQFQRLQMRLSSLPGGVDNVQASMAALFAISAKTGVALDETVPLFQSLVRSSKDLGMSTKDAERLTETIQKLGLVSGTSTEALKFGLRQLTQAMAMGVVHAEEYNSMIENMPELVQRVADVITKGSVNALRQMVIEGKLSSKELADALSKIEIKMDYMPISNAFESLLTKVKGIGMAIGEWSGLGRAASSALQMASNALPTPDILKTSQEKLQGLTEQFLTLQKKSEGETRPQYIEMYRKALVNTRAEMEKLVTLEDERSKKSAPQTIGKEFTDIKNDMTEAIVTWGVVNEKLDKTMIDVLKKKGAGEVAKLLESMGRGPETVAKLREQVAALAQEELKWRDLNVDQRSMEMTKKSLEYNKELAANKKQLHEMEAKEHKDKTHRETNEKQIQEGLLDIDMKRQKHALEIAKIDADASGNMQRKAQIAADIAELDVRHKFRNNQLSEDQLTNVNKLIIAERQLASERVMAEERHKSAVKSRHEAEAQARRNAEGNMRFGDRVAEIREQIAAMQLEADLDFNESNLRAAKVKQQLLHALSKGQTPTEEQKGIAASVAEEFRARHDLNEAMKEAIRLNDEYDPAEKYRRSIVELYRLMKTGYLTQDAFDRKLREEDTKVKLQAQDWQNGMIAGLRQWGEETKTTAEHVADAVKSTFSSMENSLTQFVMTGKRGFGDFANSVVEGLVRIAMHRMIMAPLAKGLDAFMSGMFNFGNFGGGAASGPVLKGMPSSGAIMSANGNVMTGPTLSWVGERGPEAVLPLKRDAAGKLGVASKGGGNNVVVNVIESSSGGGQVTQRQEGGKLTIDVIVQQISSKMAADIMLGRGPLVPALSRTYGARRIGT